MESEIVFMEELLPGIQIKDMNRKLNTKASESYISVSFRYNDFVWEGWIPVEYRRTGVNIQEDDVSALYTYLNKIYTQMNPSNYEAWLKKEDEKWASSRAVETKEIFNLLKDCIVGVVRLIIPILLE